MVVLAPARIPMTLSPVLPETHRRQRGNCRRCACALREPIESRSVLSTWMRKRCGNSTSAGYRCAWRFSTARRRISTATTRMETDGSCTCLGRSGRSGGGVVVPAVDESSDRVGEFGDRGESTAGSPVGRGCRTRWSRPRLRGPGGRYEGSKRSRTGLSLTSQSTVQVRGTFVGINSSAGVNPA